MNFLPQNNKMAVSSVIGMPDNMLLTMEQLIDSTGMYLTSETLNLEPGL